MLLSKQLMKLSALNDEAEELFSRHEHAKDKDDS
jgi:hypothetical protein